MAREAWLRILANGQFSRKNRDRATRSYSRMERSSPRTRPPPSAESCSAWWRENPVGFSREVPRQLLATWLPRENQIALVELFAVVMAVAHFGPELTGRNVMFLVDSEPALDALVKGLSKFHDVIHLLTFFWHVVANFQINAYLDRVSTDANVSDGVSRADLTAFDEWGWDRVFPDPVAILQEGPEAQACRPKGSRRSKPGGGQGPKRRGKGRRVPADDLGVLVPEPALGTVPTRSAFPAHAKSKLRS